MVPRKLGRAWALGRREQEFRYHQPLPVQQHQGAQMAPRHVEETGFREHWRVRLAAGASLCGRVRSTQRQHRGRENKAQGSVGRVSEGTEERENIGRGACIL